ncbi:hypothetical protein GCM10008995_22150 [Halobellus salinus]|uniref:Uncharacterized protein n=1 Tax=Halobellus salinus TaxID=931585 RepID=A0A830EPR2_9EURY|nr:hypothetical protein [Halobellus salinus]GGJ11820.1 hypothetical protein GCM10008995_22150 [Halobellus salinus]SMP03083.1 hypothetical protein SAMN06265347_101262 [Halobellus salinus]
MHALAVDESRADRDRDRDTRRIDVTDVDVAQVIEYAASRGDLHFERRGGWTYLIEEQ